MTRIGYIRSANSQGAERSFEGQRRKIMAAAARAGLAIDAWIEEVGAGTEIRPKLRALEELGKQGVLSIHVASLDRIARDVQAVHSFLRAASAFTFIDCADIASHADGTDDHNLRGGVR